MLNTFFEITIKIASLKRVLSYKELMSESDILKDTLKQTNEDIIVNLEEQKDSIQSYTCSLKHSF
jgi:hypothetical protein